MLCIIDLTGTRNQAAFILSNKDEIKQRSNKALNKIKSGKIHTNIRVFRKNYNYLTKGCN